MKNYILPFILVLIIAFLAYKLYWPKKVNTPFNGTDNIELRQNDTNEIRAIKLKLDQLTQLIPSVVSRLNDMNIKLSKVRMYNEIIIKTKDSFNVHFKDTIIKNIVFDTIRYGEYFNKWMNFQLYCNGNDCQAFYNRTDTLIVAAHKTKRDNRWQLWKLRPIMLDAALGDTNSTLIYKKAIYVQ